MTDFQTFERAVTGVQPLARCVDSSKVERIKIENGRFVPDTSPVEREYYHASLIVGKKCSGFVVSADNFNAYEVAVMADEMMERLK